MNEKNIIKRSAKDLRKGRTNFDRLRELSDDDIATAVAKDKDAAPIDIDWSDAELIMPPSKKPVSIRLDEDIIRHFKSLGPGYQTRINAVLRHYVEQKKAG